MNIRSLLIMWCFTCCRILGKCLLYCVCLWCMLCVHQNYFCVLFMFLWYVMFVLRDACFALTRIETLISKFIFTKFSRLDFIIKDLPLIFILVIANQILNDSLSCSYKYDCWLCRFICQLYILLWIFLINLFEHFWI